MNQCQYKIHADLIKSKIYISLTLISMLPLQQLAVSYHKLTDRDKDKLAAILQATF